jgi:hypothetical protein
MRFNARVVGCFVIFYTLSIISFAWQTKELSEKCVPDELKNTTSFMNILSPCHKVNQTYDGRNQYQRDNNIWIYSSQFADIFGMEEKFINQELGGIEAAAFRIEHLDYGLCNGDKQPCYYQKMEVLDIYIDEKKYPMPWLHHEQTADWHNKYNSTNFLKTKTEYDGAPILDTADFIQNSRSRLKSTLHPFVDPVSKKEAVYLEGQDSEKGNWEGMVYIIGYKRNAIEGLTLISLHFSISEFDKQKPMTYRLTTDSDSFHTDLDAKNFHSFSLPSSFLKRIDYMRRTTNK